MKIERDWKEAWIDEMGLIVALSGEPRFARLASFMIRLRELPEGQQASLKECIRQRFTPSGGLEGCQEATAAVREVNQWPSKNANANEACDAIISMNPLSSAHKSAQELAAEDERRHKELGLVHCPDCGTLDNHHDRDCEWLPPDFEKLKAVAEARARCLLSIKYLVEDHCQVTLQKADGRYYAYDVSVEQWVLGEGATLELAVENFRQKWLERFPKIRFVVPSPTKINLPTEPEDWPRLNPQSRPTSDSSNAGPSNAAAKLGPPDSRSPHASNPPTDSGTHANPS